MNQYNPDLEANLIDEDYYYDDNRFNRDIPHPEQVEVVEQDPLRVGNNDFDASPRFNIASIIISVGKVIASTVVLIVMDHSCISLSEIWVYCMLIHDIMNIFTLSLRLKNIYAIRELPSQQEPAQPENEEQNEIPQELHNRGNGPALQGEEAPENRVDQEDEVNENGFTATAKILKRIQRIKILSHLCLWFWSALFVTGICLNAFMDLTPCQAPETDHLLLVYLILAGIWLFSPVLLLVVGCLCLPVLLVLAWFIGRPKPANNAAIKKLPVIKYSEDLPGEKECVICMVEYQGGDKVVQLRCNPMHYFHEKCGKKWLKINGQCPMCRERIDQKESGSNNQAEESGLDS